VASGRWRGRAVAGLSFASAVGDAVWARENEIGWAWEHQWVTAVL
jgi:hypothetical protein